MDDSQIEIEEMQTAKRKVDKEMEGLQDRIDELSAENQKVARSKKKVQEEVSENIAVDNEDSRKCPPVFTIIILLVALNVVKTATIFYFCI